MCAAGDAGMLSGQPQLQPSFSLHVEFGGGAATWSGHGIACQQKVPVTRHVGFEVRARSFVHPTVWYCISQQSLLICLLCGLQPGTASHIVSTLSCPAYWPLNSYTLSRLALQHLCQYLYHSAL